MSKVIFSYHIIKIIIDNYGFEFFQKIKTLITILALILSLKPKFVIIVLTF